MHVHTSSISLKLENVGFGPTLGQPVHRCTRRTFFNVTWPFLLLSFPLFQCHSDVPRRPIPSYFSLLFPRLLPFLRSSDPLLFSWLATFSLGSGLGATCLLSGPVDHSPTAAAGGLTATSWWSPTPPSTLPKVVRSPALASLPGRSSPCRVVRPRPHLVLLPSHPSLQFTWRLFARLIAALPRPTCPPPVSAHGPLLSSFSAGASSDRGLYVRARSGSLAAAVVAASPIFAHLVGEPQ